MTTLLNWLWPTTRGSTPEIHVSLSVCLKALSRSGSVPFSIILTATLRAPRPVTVLSFMTLLSTSEKALYEGGFTFTDTNTGVPAPRANIDLCYDFGDGGILLGQENASMFLELQPGIPCRVEHALRLVPPAPEDATGAQPIYVDEGDASGLESGRVYKIGLGDEQATIAWWTYGTKDDVLNAGAGQARRVSMIRNQYNFLCCWTRLQSLRW